MLAGILGSVSVVAANAWMNAPSGFTLDSGGKVVDVDPVEVIFNDAMPLMAAHMVIAAYVVGGFLVASVYAVGMLRGRRDRYHRLGLPHPVHRRGDRHPDPDGRRRLAGPLGLQQPAGQVRRHRARARDAQRRPRDAARPAQRRRHGQRRASRSPAWRRGCRTRPTARAPSIQGLDTVPEDERPTIRQVNTVHLAWDVMVGLGTLLFLLSVWYWPSWIFRRRHAREQAVPARRRVRRRARGHHAWRRAGWSARSAASRGSSTTR